MFQLYRESIEDIFKLVISTLLLKPSQRAKELESFNKDLFITLIGVQGEFSTDIAIVILVSTSQIVYEVIGFENIKK